MSAQQHGVKGCDKAGRNPNPDGAVRTRRHKAVKLAHQLRLKARHHISNRVLARFTEHRLDYQMSAAENIYPLR